jgi:hypothetical protein
MKQQILSAYLSHDGNVVAIAARSYFILNAELSDEDKHKVIEKINSVRVIETERWTEKK